MDAKKLAALAAAVDQGSFTRAAVRCSSPWWP